MIDIELLEKNINELLKKNIKDLLAENKIEEAVSLLQEQLNLHRPSLNKLEHGEEVRKSDFFWDLGVNILNGFQETELHMSNFKDIANIFHTITQFYILLGDLQNAEKCYYKLSCFYENSADYMADTASDFKVTREYYESAIQCLEQSDESFKEKERRKFDMNLSILSAAFEYEKKLIEQKNLKEAREIAEFINDFYCNRFFPRFDKMRKMTRAKQNEYPEKDFCLDPVYVEQNAEALSFVFEAYNALIPLCKQDPIVFEKAKYFANEIEKANLEIAYQSEQARKQRLSQEKKGNMEYYSANALMFNYQNNPQTLLFPTQPIVFSFKESDDVTGSRSLSLTASLETVIDLTEDYEPDPEFSYDKVNKRSNSPKLHQKKPYSKPYN